MASKKLTQKQWDAIKIKRETGVSTQKLAEEYGVSRQAIHQHFSLQEKNAKMIAKEILNVQQTVNNGLRTHAGAETKLTESLQDYSIEVQADAFDLATTLTDTSRYLVNGAKIGSKTAFILKERANVLASQMGVDADPDTIMKIAALEKTANEAVRPAIQLLSLNNKDALKPAASKKMPTMKQLQDLYFLGIDYEIDDS